MLEANVFGLHTVTKVVGMVLAYTVKTGPASGTVATTVGEGGDNEVARLNRRDVTADFFDDPDSFVTGVFGMCGLIF